MNDYKSYMNRVTVSDALHEKLLHLEETRGARKPARWPKYAAAACAVLLAGIGAWGVGTRLNEDRWRDLVGSFNPYAGMESVQPSNPDPVPCAAPSHPAEGDGTQPGMKTIGSYEEYTQIAGVDVTIFHTLPWIDYGSANEASASLDWDLPAGAARRDLSADEVVTLLGGADAVDLHLDWSGYELSGWAAWYEDGSFWGAYLQGYKGSMDHFEFAVTRGSLPPTCVVFGGSVEQEVWGITVTADKYDGKDGCARRVSFMKDDYGYRFDLTATGEPEDAEKLVSRAVTWIADGDGLNFPIALFRGEMIFPSQEPGSPADEPNWNDEIESPPSPPSQDGASSPSRNPAGAEEHP